MAGRVPYRLFNVEALEPRLLLSAAPAGAEATPAALGIAPAECSFCSDLQDSPLEEASATAAQTPDLFEGLAVEELGVTESREADSGDVVDEGSGLDCHAGLDPAASAGKSAVALASVQGEPPAVDLVGALQLVPPFGAGVYSWPGLRTLGDSSMGLVDGQLDQTGDSRLFRIALDGSQVLSVRLGSLGTGIEARLDILSPTSQLLATALTLGPTPCEVQAEASEAGTYSILVTSVQGQSDFSLTPLLGGQFESERGAAKTNDTIAAAEWLGPVNTRGPPAVVGNVYADSPDWYSLDLNAGDTLTLTAAVLRFAATRQVDLQVADTSGIVLARGIAGGSLGLDEYLCTLQAPASGRYYIRVSGDTYATYTLAAAVGRQVDFGLPSAGEESPQRLQNGQPVMGFLDDPEYSLEPDDYAHGSFLTDAVNGLHLSVLGLGSTDPVTAVISPRKSTGTNAFGHGTGSDNYKWSSNRSLLRADFAQPVASVSVDAIAVNAYSYEWAFLQAYNAAGQQIAVVQTPGGASMNIVYNLAVHRLVPDIAYIVVGGLGGYDTALDNLVVGMDHADAYQVQFEPGAAVEIQTATPGDGSGEPFNTLDPRLAVYDEGGTLVVSDDTGMPDIKNARVQFTAGSGLYTVRVEGRGRGEYTLQFAQGVPLNPGPTIVASDPVPDAFIAHVPARIVFTCSEGIRADLLNPASLTVDAFGAATAVELLDGQTVAFTINVPDVEGSYTYHLAAGALVDLQGLTSTALDGAFAVDRTGPRVVEQVPSPAINKPLTSLVLTFSEPLLASSVSTADVVSFTGPGGTDIKYRISRLDVEGSAVTVRFGSQLTADGEYRLVLGPNIQDLVGNGMDQDQNGINGETTDRYTALFDLQLPDLTVDSVTFSPVAAEFGRPLDITWITRNTGRGAADGPWNVWVRLSKDAVPSPDDWALASLLADAPNPLAAGATHNQTIHVALPLQSQFTDGTYYVFVEVDKDKQVYELVETNNTGSGTINITVPLLPDLQISGSVAPTTINPGGEVRVEWTVTNNGQAPGDIPWRDVLYLSRNQTFEEANDVWLLTYDATPHQPLLVSGSYTASQTVVIPDTTTVATYYVLVLADRYGDQLESLETNNLAALRLDVKAPDLTVAALTGPANALHGASIDVSWTVRNGGTFAATKAWSDGFYLSTNTTWSADDILVTTVPTTAPLPLATSATHQQTARITLPLQPELVTGRYYLLAKADALGALPETNENNNVRSFSINLTVPPLPDLAVTDITAPITANSGQEIPISWTITNQGTATAKAPYWVDLVYLADNSAGNDPVWYGEFSFDGEIGPGESVVRTKSIRLPYDLSGSWWVVVSVDASNKVYEHGIEANNRQVDNAPINVQLSPFPNLQVLSVQALSSVFTQQEVRFEWVVTNSGTAPTTVPVWQDEVWVSLDRILNPLEDCLIGRAQNLTALAPGESYTNSLTAKLGYEPYGDCYVIVVADRFTRLDYDWDGNVVGFLAEDRMLEPGHEEDNTGVSDVFPLALTPPPDLQVVWVEAPYDAYAGQTVTVKFRVENRGLGPTAGPGSAWKDRVYFSRDENPADEGDVALAGMYYLDALQPGEGYTVTKSVQIPADASGDYYLIALTNWNPKLHLYEDGFNGNNTAHAGHVTTIRVPTPPDLEALGVDMPTEGMASRDLLINWVVKNAGPGNTPSDRGWIDAFFLSTDPVWDQHDIRMATFGYQRPVMEPGALSPATAALRIPDGVEGTFYLILRTDYGDSIKEANENNNTVASSHTIDIVSRPADLVAAWKTVPLTGPAAGAIWVEWTVTNQGTGDTVVDSWWDAIFLNPGEQRLAAIDHRGILGPGKSYTARTLVELPADAPGVAGLFVKADWPPNDLGNGAVFEGANEGNNDSAQAAINITTAPADLFVTSLVAPTAGLSGQTIAMEWTVTNLGTGFTLAEYWYDKAVLSLDQVWDDTDIVLPHLVPNQGTPYPAYRRGEPLGPNQSYTFKGRPFLLPLDLSGSYYIIVRTDNQNLVPEAEETNNDRVSTDPIVVTFAGVPDLLVDVVTVPTAAYAGAGIEVSWTVRNTGVSTTESWDDYVFLSPDTVFEPGADFFAGRVKHEGGLEHDATYEASLTAVVPPGMTGSFYAFVFTDRTDRIEELQGDTNNVNASVQPTQISLPPPVDLTVGSIILPANGVPGQLFSFTYQLNNLSGFATSGPWTDAIYLSADATWDLDDPVIALVDRDSLGGMAQRTYAVTATLPGVNPGQYHVLVRTDSRNTVRETDERNNLTASLGQITLDVSTIVLGQAVAGTLAQGQLVYYRVEVPEADGFLVSLDSASDDAFNELYVSYGAMPTRSQHDFHYTAQFAADQQVLIPTPEKGTYYILAYGNQAPDTAPSYTLLARLIGFEVLDTNFGVGGTAGDRTIEIHGAQFDRTVVAALARADGFSLQARSHWYVDSTRMFATFDLTQAAPGTYDVVLTKAGGDQVTVPDSFTVVAGGGAQVRVELGTPPAVTWGVEYSLSVTWYNDGLNDGLAPLIAVHSTDCTFSTTPGGNHDRTGLTFLGIAMDGGPAGVLRPGAMESLRLFAYAIYAVGAEEADWYAARVPVPDNGEPFNWDYIRSLLRDEIAPATMYEAQFQTIFVQFAQQTGTTNHDFLAMLARNATLLPWSVTAPVTLEQAIALEFRRAWAASGNSISGRGMAPDMALDISDRAVSARLSASGEWFVTSSLSDGSFIFETVPAGSYEIDFDGAWVRQGGSVTVAAGEPLTSAVLELDVGGSVDGMVRAEETGQIISGALVSLRSADYSQALMTDAHGSFRFTALPTGTYEMEVAAEGRAPSGVANLFIDHTAVSLNIVLLKAGSIMGQVRLEPAVELSQPLTVVAERITSGASADLYSAGVAGLSYSFGDLPEGSYELTFVHPQLLTHRTGPVAVASNETVETSDIVLTKAASIAGTVVSRVPTVPATGQDIGVFQGNALVRVVTVADSNFQIDSLAAGQYRLAILGLDEGLSIDVTVSLETGEEESGVTIEIVQGGTISGTVTNVTIGQPLAGIEVVVTGPDGVSKTASTSSDGSYVVKALGAGEHKVALSTPGAAPARAVTVADPDGGQYIADWAINLVASVRGYLQLEDGTRVGGGAVTLRRDGYDVVMAPVGEDGAYGFVLLQAGQFELRATANGVSFAPQSILVTAGIDQTINISAGSASITFGVDDPNSVLTGASLSLYQVLAGELVNVGAATLDEGEQVAFSHLAPGAYRVDVRAADNRGSQVTFNLAPGRQETMTVGLATRLMLTGKVLGPGDQPIEQGQVWLYPAGSSQPVAFDLTSAEGAFALPYLAAGEYDLVVLAEGYGVAMRTLTVSADASLVVPMAPSASTLTGRVLDAFSQPIAGATVTVQDAVGRILGQTQTGADGRFQITTATGTNLVLLVQAFGCGVVQQTGWSIASGQTVALPDSALDGVAFAAKPPAFGATQPQAALASIDPGSGWGRLAKLLGSWTRAGLMGSDPSETPPYPGPPSYISVILDSLGDADRRNDEPSESDVVDCPEKCVPICYAGGQDALAKIKSLDVWWEAQEKLEEAVDKYCNIALGMFASEFALNFVTVASAILIGYGIAAYFGATGALSALQGVGAFATIFGYVNTALGLISSIGLAWYDAATATEPMTTVGIIETGGGLVSTLGGTIDTAYSAVKALQTTAGSALRGSLIGLAGMLFSWRSIVSTFSYSRTSSACYELATAYDSWKFAYYDKYYKGVSEAKTKLEMYLGCIKRCNDENTNGKDKKIPIKLALDPNDIIGPNGYGAERWISPSTPLLYTIQFENDPLLATGLARTIRLTQTLDPDLDPRSFRLVDIGIGTHRFVLPKNISQYYARLDLTADLGVYLDIAAGIDVSTGKVFWNLSAIDPDTGLVPIDPFLGLLPPNTNAPEGQGWVTYTVEARANAPTNSAVEAQATIVFDQNEPIDTPVFVNLLDSAAPSSAAQALPAETDTAQFQVSWSGTDETDGSALASFSVYVSDSGQPFTLWIADATFREAPFAGQPGHTYAFYSVARDNAGNIEKPPATPDAVTRVTGATSSLGDFVWLDVNGNGQWDQGESGMADVTVNLLNSLGGLIATTKTQADGSYRFTNLAPGGIYQLEFVAPYNHRLTPAHLIADDTRDSDPDPATGRTPLITLDVGDNLSWDAGLYVPATIEGTVWNDADTDGVNDLGEAGLSSWLVYLDLNRNGQFDAIEPSQRANSQGTYRFTDLLPGRYVVAVSMLGGWVQTTPGPAGWTDPGGPVGWDFATGEFVLAGAQELKVSAYSVPALADWNNDGRPDLIVGEKTNSLGKVRIYLNTGTAQPPAFDTFFYAQANGQDLAVVSGECLGAAPRVADWDQDGRKDLLIGLGDGTLRVFLNDHTDVEPRFAAGVPVMAGPSGAKTPISVNARAIPELVDWNNDGRIDLLLGAQDGKVRLYLNDAATGAPDLRAAVALKDGGIDLVISSGRSSPTVADIDHDGRKDLVVGNSNGDLHLFLNVGTDADPRFAGSRLLSSAGVPIELGTTRARPFLADMDGDGLLDLLVGGTDGFVRRYEQVSVPSGEPALPYTRSVYVASDEAQQQVDFGYYRPNRAPTLSTVNSLTGARERTTFTITYEMLAAAANESDPDGDTLWFRVETVLAGTLEKDGAPVLPGQTLLGAGESLRWQPPAVGTISAFNLRAWDGELASATAVQVKVVVGKLPPPPPPIARGIEVLEGNRSVGGAVAPAQVSEPTVVSVSEMVPKSQPALASQLALHPTTVPANQAAAWKVQPSISDDQAEPLKVSPWKPINRLSLRPWRACISVT